MIEQLKKYLELAEKATPGPWKPDYEEVGVSWPGKFILKDGLPLQFGWDGEEGIYADNNFDLEFIAASRTMGPALAKALIRAIDALRDQNFWVCTMCEANQEIVTVALADIEKILNENT